MLVGRVVVGDQVQFQALGRLPVDLFEKTQPFDMRVALLGAGDQLALQIVERREQRGRAMAPIIMRHRARMTWAERQARLRALQRLTLAFLVAAQHQRIRWRVKIEPYHVPELLLEIRVGRQLERPGDMRLQVVLRPDALHRAV